MRPRLLRVFALVLFATACPTHAAFAQTAETDEDASPVWATLEIEPGQPTKFQVVGRALDPAIAVALARVAGRAPQTAQFGGDWTQWTIELPSPARRGLILRQSLGLDPLLETLRGQGQPDLSMTIQHPPAGFVTITGGSCTPIEDGRHSATIATRPPDGSISLELGWRPIDVARAAGLLLLALVAPILAGLAIWRRSIARDRAPQAWFVRAQSIQLVIMAGWVLWMILVEVARAPDLVAFASSGRGWYPPLATPLWMLGFLPSALFLVGIARRVIRRLRGFDPLRPGVAGRIGSLRTAGLLMLLVVASGAFAAENLRLGVFALLAAVVGGVLWPGARGPLGATPQSLSQGPLRDRLFDLAHRAGVKLRELYVVPMRRERMANAFAVHGGMVMVADELLDRMSRREVDAVLAHEISHLEHHHPIKTLLIAAGVGTLILTPALALRIPFGSAAALAVFWLTLRFVARRFEVAADAGAAGLTGDAEALISGLGRLARVNDTPFAWGRGWAWLVTHPTTEARALAIGRRAGIAPERVAELLASGIDPGPGYGDRDRPGEQGRVFSTAWKSATLGRLGIAMLTASVLAPAAALAVVRAFGVTLPHPIAVVAGAALSLLAVLMVHDGLAARVVSRLEPALRMRLAGSAVDPRGDGERFVALSPGDRARVYEGFLDWDIGLLAIGPASIRYRGEQTTIELPRGAVRAIELGAAGPSWIRAPRVIVRWVGPSGEEAVALRAAVCRKVSGIAPASRALASELESWRKGPAAHGGGDAPPGLGSVTARTPAQAAAPRDMLVVVAVSGMLSVAAGFALGFDMRLGLDLFAASLIGVVAMRWPAMTSRDPSRKSGTREPVRRAA